MTQEALNVGILIVTAISAFGVIVSAVFSAFAANASRKSVKLSLQIFEEQKKESEKKRKAAFETESSKLHRSIYFLMSYFHKQNMTKAEERTIAFTLKEILGISSEQLDKVDISVFSKTNQNDITYVQVSIRHHIVALSKVSSQDDPILEQIFLQIYGLNVIIRDRLQQDSLEENEITK